MLAITNAALRLSFDKTLPPGIGCRFHLGFPCSRDPTSRGVRTLNACNFP